MKKTLLGLSLAACSTLTFAEGLYAGGAYNQFKDSDIDLATLAVVIGYDFNDTFALEGRLGKGVEDQNYTGGKLEIDSYASLMGVLSLPVNENFGFYGELGYAYADLKVSGPLASLSESGSDPQYGAGIFFKVDSAKFKIGYSKLGSGDSFDGFAAQVNFAF